METQSRHGSAIAALGILLLALPARAFPPGSPMSEFGPSQVSLSCYFDHSGQDLFDNMSPSVLNSTGFSLDYGPWSFFQMGLFLGAAEFDVGLPATDLNDSGVYAYNTDYNFSGGGSLKLATPRFASGTTRLVGFGSLTYIDSKDKAGNSKTGLAYNAGGTLQYLFASRINFVLGAEFYTIIGDQKDTRGNTGSFGTSAPYGATDYLRGIIGVEYFFKGKNKPFISVSFRPTGNLGWDDNLGIRNGSIAVSLGAMASLGKEKPDAGEEDPGMVDQ